MPNDRGTLIDYDLPTNGAGRLLGRMCEAWYAGWCTRRMAREAAAHFS